MSDLAIKYSMMKKKKRMAEGGPVEDRAKMSGKSGLVRTDTEANQNSKGVNRHGHKGSSGGISEAGAYHRDSQSGYKKGNEYAKSLHKQTLEESRAMPSPNLKGLAEGGEVDDELVTLKKPSRSYDDRMAQHVRGRQDDQKGVHHSTEHQPGRSHAGVYASKGYEDLAPGTSKAIHAKKLEELKSMPNPKLKGLADGGFVEEENMSGYVDHPEDEEMMNEAADQEDDLVSRALKSRKNMYSEGGKVANEGEDEMSHMADSDPNEFDDLALEDDLKSSYTGANSGDELGNEQEDQDREDIVSRVMASRRKKDRLPNPR